MCVQFVTEMLAPLTRSVFRWLGSVDAAAALCTELLATSQVLLSATGDSCVSKRGLLGY